MLVEGCGARVVTEQERGMVIGVGVGGRWYVVLESGTAAAGWRMGDSAAGNREMISEIGSGRAWIAAWEYRGSRRRAGCRLIHGARRSWVVPWKSVWRGSIWRRSLESRTSSYPFARGGGLGGGNSLGWGVCTVLKSGGKMLVGMDWFKRGECCLGMAGRCAVLQKFA